MEIVASSANVEFRADAPGPENSGAGGNGRLGLPPYRDEGVPGRGLPFKSGGSYRKSTGGGLPNSEEPLEGLHDRVGEALPFAVYGTYCVSEDAIEGAVSRIEGAREYVDVTEGW